MQDFNTCDITKRLYLLQRAKTDFDQGVNPFGQGFQSLRIFRCKDGIFYWLRTSLCGFGGIGPFIIQEFCSFVRMCSVLKTKRVDGIKRGKGIKASEAQPCTPCYSSTIAPPPATYTASQLFLRMSHCHDEHHDHSHGHGSNMHEDGHDHSDDITPALQYSLYQYIDFDAVTTFNEAEAHSGRAILKKTWAERLEENPELESDADEQLLMTVP